MKKPVGVGLQELEALAPQPGMLRRGSSGGDPRRVGPLKTYIPGRNGVMRELVVWSTQDLGRCWITAQPVRSLWRGLRHRRPTAWLTA